MKKLLCLATLSAVVLIAPAAYAEIDNNVSVTVLGGWASHPGLMQGGVKRDMSDGFNAGARVSTDLHAQDESGLSLDGDVFYNQSGYHGTGARLNSSSVMGGVTYHVATATPWSFYGGGGLGVVHDNLDGNLHGSADVLGWQAIGGTEYAMTPSTSLVAEYRYQNAHDANVGITHGVGNTSNNVSVGVKLHL